MLVIFNQGSDPVYLFTKTLAAELGSDGFVCLAIHPGWVATDMGGPNAPLTPEQSVSGMKAVIDNLGAEDNGKYRSYDGDVVAW